MVKTFKEITFISNCRICGRKKLPCRTHHIVPRRLLKRLGLKKQKEWEFQKIVICNDCNKEMHPENRYYLKWMALDMTVKKMAKELSDLKSMKGGITKMGRPKETEEQKIQKQKNKKYVEVVCSFLKEAITEKELVEKLKQI